MREVPMWRAPRPAEDVALSVPGKASAPWRGKNEPGRVGAATHMGMEALGRVLVAGAIVALLGGCAPVSDPSAGMSVADTVALIDRTPRSDIQIADLAEAFALGTKSTDVQRDALEKELIGRTVEWEIPVYDVSFADGRFEVTSQPIPTSNRAEAVPLLRVMAWVLVRDDADQAALMKVKTDDVIRVRGIVQEIRARTIVAVVPAVVVRPSQIDSPSSSS